MVTGREILWDFGQIGVRLIAWLMGVPLLVLTILRFVAEDRLWLVGMWTTFAPYCFVPVIPILILTILFQTWRSTLLLVITLLAAGLWLGPVLLQRPGVVEAAEGTRSLRVVTYTPDRAFAVYDDFRQWIDETSADIVVVQDFRLMNGRGLLDRVAADFPYIFWSFPVWRPASGNLLLSRYPILEQAVVVPGGDAAGNTMVTRALLMVNDQPVAVYNVDLARSYGSGRPRFVVNGLEPIINRYLTGYDATARNAGLDQLLAQIAQETQPYVVLGNFGFTPMHAAYGRLASVMNEAQREAGYGMAVNWPLGLGGGIPPVAQFDYIWHSPQHWQSVQVFAGPHLESRRLPLVADLRLLPVDPPK
jgi:endonuclease/exonuclease/phosphatase (EEP) superfamily protein YafD